VQREPFGGGLEAAYSCRKTRRVSREPGVVVVVGGERSECLDDPGAQELD
jgi:hypothetical protein